MEIEKLLDSKTIYEGKIINLRIDHVELPSGKQTIRETVQHGDSVVVVAIDSDDNVLLVRQYRTAVGKVLLEIPAGKVDPGEHPLQAMHRELREETGYTAKEVRELGGIYASPGFVSEYLHLYLATDLTNHNESPDGDEIMDVFCVSLKDIPDLIARGDICDAKTVAGLMRVLYDRLATGQ